LQEHAYPFLHFVVEIRSGNGRRKGAHSPGRRGDGEPARFACDGPVLLAGVGYVHENHAFPRYLSAAELLDYYGALSLVPPEVLRQRVPQLLARVGLADRRAEPISRFSKGMVQRLGRAQALVNDPKLLVLDEPTEGLDLEGRQLMREVVGEVRNRGGSVLLVSHVLGEVEQLCDRVGVLVGGRLVYLGTMADLLRGADGPRTLEQALQGLYAGRPPA
jgi:ABC-2 type transport system ATP-binding protein